MDTANLDVRVKKKAVIELAEFGYSLGVISTILGIRYNIAERALINELGEERGHQIIELIATSNPSLNSLDIFIPFL